MRLLRACAAIVLLSSLVGCGAFSGASPRSRDIVATITAPSFTTPINSVLPLQGHATGFTERPQVSWWVEEQNRSTFYCGTDFDETTPSPDFCPCGYVRYEKSRAGVPAFADYHAPSTPGTCHIWFDAMQMEGYNVLAEKSTSVTVTVVP